ncbi:DHH family phosphoesterase [Hydrogenoanaerobacterium sp.]|uniref:DHH family phosphoesterase n=1 Tax=Hydrogenoanaerobacterium sp. TaxID=2953763 RepID=UPI002899FCDE|nr:DHH family phosphoesterase [Hydrogenoanaerobacterium sp.]
MKSKVWLFKPIFYMLVILSVVLTLLTGLFNTSDRTLFYVEAALTITVILFVIIRLRNIQKDIKSFLQNMGQTLTSAQKETLTSFPIPVLVASRKGEIIWYNTLFQKSALGQDDMYGCNIDEIIPNIDMDHLAGSEGYEIEFRDHMFTVYAVESLERETPLVVFYFNDDTKLKKTAQEFEDTRPSVGVIMIDNCEELQQAAKESERAQLTGKIEYLLIQYVAASNGLLKKLERDKYLMVVEEKSLRTMLDNRFDVLDKVREIVVGDNQMPATLSIGIGRGATNLRDSEQMARQALEMALGRGGDQAAVRTANGYEFFGGVSKGIEKRTKVKTRIVASALMELIEGSDNVMLMGHQFADLDCLGAAVGLLKGVRMMGKPVSIVLSKERNLAQPLYERLINNGYEDAFLDPAMAVGLITKKTLLIVVDTHIQHILESEEVYKACKNVVVIDHHRKMVGHIDRAVIFYHEPYASSASEMVTELLQYFGDNRSIGRLEAEALLAGIMLDTRNFVLRTGVRTFEAAAYLRKLGADTVEVRKLFANTMESYQHKTQLVSAAEIYKGCAVATTSSNNEDIKLVAPQAADELLGINGVDASFVMYEYEGGTSFSARSMGAMNVQLIMEKMGGGGHQTMAGAQLVGIPLEDARQRLFQAIDEYHAENVAKQQKALGQ